MFGIFFYDMKAWIYSIQYTVYTELEVFVVLLPEDFENTMHD